MSDTQWLLLGDVARLVRCRPHQIVYLLTTGQVPEPALRVGNRRIFSVQDVERIRATINKKRGDNE
jgi:DNA-binding transcriptional MerR regulator